MRIFKTESSRKKGYFHILKSYNPHRKLYTSLCTSGDYWVGGYHGNKPQIHPDVVEYTGQRLCPSCVMQAYKNGLVDIVEKH
jgi:hypothetical protein